MLAYLMELDFLKAVVSLLLIVHIKYLIQTLKNKITLISFKATHNPSVALLALNTYENFP